MTSLLAHTDGGSAVLDLMLACGIVGLIDVLLNDFARGCFKVDIARRHRHFGLAALAFCYVCHVFVAVLSIKSWWMAAFNLWNALAIVAFSFIDAQQRSKVSTCPQF
ncbi:hypothetical protein [Burkholderia gladioli]|uniref:hypothetical protein n=1 Tax=Burkholderia gladioli TaxID=28095 RepID=UPI001FC8B411|nr:hypothetical protein [Burkholderia gladioli]